MDVDIDGVELQIRQGDITSQPDIDAVVNAANAQLRTGGGVAGAIHDAAGPGLVEECRPLAPIEPGEAVITGGHELPNSHVIHCLGPRYGKDSPEAELLANCYDNSLALAEEHGLSSVAFPAISTGAFGYPIDRATEIALETVVDRAPDLQSVETVRFVLFSDSDRDVYRRTLEDLT
ncbi:MAG: macro domain-containing protein [Bradymonadaceae bacterium]